MRILVTGSAGFIGFHTVRALVNSGHEVVGIDNLNTYYDVDLKYGRLEAAGISLPRGHEEGGAAQLIPSTAFASYRFAKIDITDRAGLNRLFVDERFDAVCHLAAQAGVRYSIKNPHTYVESNIEGFLNILEGEPIKVYNNGEMKRDFTYIDDIVRAVEKIIVSPPSSPPKASPSAPSETNAIPFRLYNIGNNSPVPLMRFIGEIEKQLGREAEKVYLPMQPGDVAATWADSSALQHEFGFSPSTPVSEGIEKFVDWYRNYYKD